MEPLWMTSGGVIKTPSSMDDEHIKNTIKCLKGEGKSIIPDKYLGLKKERWLEIFNNEVLKRNIPLIFN